MIKSTIIIVSSFIFLIINTLILFLKPEFNFAINDDDNYCVVYQKWISTVVFMSDIIIALFVIYFSVDFSYFLGLSFLTIECILTIVYALVKYKGITVCGDKIKIERLFVTELNCKFKDITKVIFIPNAKVVVHLKNKVSFEVSFNSENFHKFYKSLIKNDVKFKTTYVPNDENHVYLTKFNMTVLFPKTMFREYYQSETYLRNSNYLFSARSLENHEYIEGYLKKSDKNLDYFVDIIKNDLKINGFKSKNVSNEVFDGFEFKVINSENIKNPEKSRLAYIYKTKDAFFIIYADFNTNDLDKFVERFKEAIKKPLYIDSRSSFARI